MGLSLEFGEFDGAGFGGGDGAVDGFAEVGVLKDLECGGSGASGGGDGIAQGVGVVSGLLEEFCGAEEGLNGEGIGEFRRESGVGAGLLECGGKFEKVGGATAAECGDGVELFFGYWVVLAECAEDVLHDSIVFGLKWPERGVGADSGADLPGGIGHGADDVGGFREGIVEALEGGSSEDGDEEFASRAFDG